MKTNVFLSILSFLIFAMSCEKTLTAEMIIEKSLEEAHGGKAKWEMPKILIYEKITTLYDSLGNVERVKKQTFHNTLQPEFKSKVIWKEDGIEKRIVFDGKEAELFFNQTLQTNKNAIKKAYQEVMGAQYVLWQPYKLLTDTDITLKLEGKVSLEDGSEAYKIRVISPNDRVFWWYYFDTETFLLRENLVHHITTYSQIKNIQLEAKTGLYLNKERKSYIIDSTRNQKYLRAHYFYTILKLE